MKVLILFAHPAFHKSRVNQEMVKGLSELADLTFHDLYEAYPEFDIDIEAEQALMAEHDVIVFQFPIFWYSTPAILKEWQDLVLQHGWAYGSQGNALKGKLFLCSVTAGGPQEAYTKEGFHKHTLNELIAPLRQTARLCKMTFLPPFAVHGSHRIEDDKLQGHKKAYLKLLESFREDRFDTAAALMESYLNDYVAKQL